MLSLPTNFDSSAAATVEAGDVVLTGDAGAAERFLRAFVLPQRANVVSVSRRGRRARRTDADSTVT